MKPRFFIIIFLGAVIGYRCQSDRLPHQQIHAALQATMDESIQNSGVIGVSAAVLFPDGDLWKGASGLSHEGITVTTGMLFDIGSVQKNFQAALALRLVEKGLMGLDDPVGKWLPPYPNIPGKVTIRQLLNLTSGLDDFVADANSPFRIGYLNINFEKWLTWEDIYAEFIHTPNFEPGTKCSYSSTNYIVLKQIIEKVTQSRQSSVFENLLLKPFHLDHTLADFTKPVPENLTIVHNWCDFDGDGDADDISGHSLNWIASLAPMLVYSTPEDMVRWMDALYHKKTVLSPDMLKAMLAFVSPVQNEPMMKGYGLGVVDINIGVLMPQWEDVRAYGHLGSSFGYTTFVAYFPDYGITMAIMFNRGCDRDTDRAIMAVGGPVFDVLLRHLGAKESKQQNSLAGMIKELKKSPGDVHLMYKIAKQHQEDKDDYESSLVFEEILKHDPENKYGYKTEALFWKSAYDGLIHKEPENLIAFISENKDYHDIKDAYRFLAKTYQRRDEMDKAFQVYRDALTLFEKDADFYNSYAWWIYENKVKTEYETAIRYARAALEQKPEAYYIWDTLAWLLFEKGEWQPALAASMKALSLAPGKNRDYYIESLEKIKNGQK